MLLNRALHNVSLLSYSATPNAYGELRKDTPTATQIEMALYPTSHANVQDPRFVDCDLIAYTKAAISDENEIKDGDTKYQILFVQPSWQGNLVYLKKLK